MSAAEPEIPIGGLVHEAGRPGASSTIDLLLVRFADLGATADTWQQTYSLRPLTNQPRLLSRLDERLRIAWRLDAKRWDGARWVVDVPADDPRRRIRATIDAFTADPDTAGPIAVAFASAHPDGRAREHAVEVMASRGLPEHLPFLVLRCDDWVRQVRTRARESLAAQLRARPEMLRMALPMASYLSGRERGGAALRIVETLIVDEFDRLAPALLRRGDQRARRLAYMVGDRLGRWTYSDLLKFALTEPDPVVRLRSAVTVCHEAVRRHDVPALRKLAAVRWAAVRSLALVGLSDLGSGDDLVAFLTDPAPLIRAYARSRVADPAAHYRAAIAACPAPGSIPVPAPDPVPVPIPEPIRASEPVLVPESIIGLAEIGDHRDVARLIPLLGAADSRVRAAAVHGLTLLDSVPIEATIPLLTDPAPAVVRAASLALRVYRRRLPPDLPWTLLVHGRPEVRLAGYRLLSARDPIIRLAAALVLAADPDPVPARRGRAEAVRLLPALLSPEPADRYAQADDLLHLGDLLPSSAMPVGSVKDRTRATLLALTDRARPALGDHFARVNTAVDQLI